MAIVTFYPTAFVARYPEFSAVSSTMLTSFFGEAEIYLNNTDTSRVKDVGLRGTLLNKIVAHIAKLEMIDLVGRISAAAEGSVTATTKMGTIEPNTAAWWNQTKYGASYWSAIRAYRSFSYRTKK